MATQNQPYRSADGNGHGNRSPREIQHEIDRTRSEMDETINELSERLNPRHLMDVAYDYFRSHTTVSRGDLADGAKSVSKTVGTTVVREIRNHPIPAMLIGAGLLYGLFVEDDDEPKRDFHSQWADLPEHSGSFVDARTGEPYDLETYGAEWRQEAVAWHPRYDWSRSDVDEQTWGERAKQSVEELRTTLSDTTRSARDKMRFAASKVVGLSGHRRGAVHSRWRNLRSHGGSWMDLQRNEPYDREHGRDWETMMACDYAATGDWSEEDEATWTAKAQHALEEMQQSLSDTSGSAKEQIQALANKIGEFVGGTRDFSSSMARSFGRRASHMGRGMGRGVSRSARYVGHQARRGGEQMSRQMSQGYAASRDAMQHGYVYSRDSITECMDDYPLAAGAAFIGLGLLLGLALPRTRYEDEVMGERSDEIKRYAKDTGREAASRARHVAEATAAAVLDEAEQQGFSPQQLAEKARHAAESVKSTVQEQPVGVGSTIQSVAEKIERVAERAVETAKEETKKEVREMNS